MPAGSSAAGRRHGHGRRESGPAEREVIPPYHWWRTVFFLIPAIAVYTIVLGTTSIALVALRSARRLRAPLRARLGVADPADDRRARDRARLETPRARPQLRLRVEPPEHLRHPDRLHLAAAPAAHRREGVARAVSLPRLAPAPDRTSARRPQESGRRHRQEDGAAGRRSRSLIIFPEGTRSGDGTRGALQGRDLPAGDRRGSAGRAGEHRRQPARDAQGAADDVPGRRRRSRSTIRSRRRAWAARALASWPSRCAPWSFATSPSGWAANVRWDLGGRARYNEPFDHFRKRTICARDRHHRGRRQRTAVRRPGAEAAAASSAAARCCSARSRPSRRIPASATSSWRCRRMSWRRRRPGSTARPGCGWWPAASAGRIRWRIAFAAVAAECDIVLVHDAARPFVSADVIARTIARRRARTARRSRRVPVSDTVKRVGRTTRVIVETLPREAIFLAQTPQAFRRDVLGAAIAAGPHVGRRRPTRRRWPSAPGTACTSSRATRRT